MNMKMNLKLDLSQAGLLKLLKQFGPSVLGLSLVALFGYTGWVVNAAFNTKPAETTVTPAQSKIVFDKSAVQTVKSLQVVPGQVAPTAIGTSNPFDGQ